MTDYFKKLSDEVVAIMECFQIAATILRPHILKIYGK